MFESLKARHHQRSLEKLANFAARTPEIQAHLEEKIAENLAKMAQKEAEKQAARRDYITRRQIQLLTQAVGLVEEARGLTAGELDLDAQVQSLFRQLGQK